MKKILESKLFLVIVTMVLSITGSIIADSIISSNSVSYQNNKTNETTVEGSLNELFSAVDINERLGNNDISTIGDGTITGTINSLTKLKTGSNQIISNLENITNTVNYIKTNGTSVNIVYTITDINQTITSSTTIATVPEEFRPPFQSFLMGMYVTSDGGIYPMVCSVNNDGRIVENMHHSFTPVTMSFVGTYPLKVK